MTGDMGQAPRARQEVDAPEKGRFWIKRSKDSLQSQSSVHKTLSEVNPNTCSMKMSLPIGIFLCLVIVSMGLTIYAIAEETEPEKEKESNTMESTIKSRSDYPDYDDLSSFFDFEIGPPQITYKENEDSSSKSSLVSRPNSNKKYYYYHPENHQTHEKLHPSSPAKKHVVTPGTHYSPTEKTFLEGEVKTNESIAGFSQYKVGNYQVSVVDANSPLLSNLGLSPEYLRRLSGYEKRALNTSMVASDSTQSATYAENPHPNYDHAGHQHHNPPNTIPYQSPYDPRYPPPSSNYADRQYKPNDRYNPSNSYGGYNQSPAAHQPPPQGSYDAKSYRAVQNGYPQNTNSYAPSYYNSHDAHNTHNNPPPPASAVPYTNPHQAPYNNPSSHPSTYNNPSSYNNPPPHGHSYNNPPPSSSPSYSPQRSSSEPWRPATQHHVDWDDKQTKKESWQNGPYPPHPPPLPYSSTSSSGGTYYSKPSYSSSSDKTGHRGVATYVKPESAPKPSYSSSSGSSSEYNSHKPYYSSSTYSSSSKVPSRAGSVSTSSSNYHDHHHAPSKPGITIRFKAKAPSHGGGHGGGVSIPLGFNPLEVVKKLLPSLNPLNNKKVTIGITIENKKDHHSETVFHPY